MSIQISQLKHLVKGEIMVLFNMILVLDANLESSDMDGIPAPNCCLRGTRFKALKIINIKNTVPVAIPDTSLYNVIII